MAGRKFAFKTARRVLLAALAFVLALFIIVNHSHLTPGRFGEWADESFARLGGGGGYPYDINANSVLDMQRFDTDVALLTDTSLMILSPSAKELCNRQHGFSNPSMDVGDERIIVFDRGGKKFAVQNRSTMLFEKELTQKIVTCAIGRQGNFAVATESAQAVCEMTVYNRNFTPLLTWYSAADHVVDAAMSPDGKYAAVATIGTVNGDMASHIIIISFKTGKEAASLDYPGTTLLSLSFTDGNTVTAVGDNLMTTVKNQTKRGETVKFDGELNRFSNHRDSGASVLLMANSSNKFLTLKPDGGKTAPVTLAKKARWIDSDGSRTAVLYDAGLEVYGSGGKPQSSVDAGTDAVRILINSKSIYVLSFASLNKYDLK